MTAVNTKATGKMENNTAKENFIRTRKTYGKKVFGAKENESDGQTMLLIPAKLLLKLI